MHAKLGSFKLTLALIFFPLVFASKNMSSRCGIGGRALQRIFFLCAGTDTAATRHKHLSNPCLV